MKIDYSIDEILNAVEELQKNKNEKQVSTQKKRLTKIETIDIPKNTLNLIEEAENSKN
tara:strand:+ start:162 stop:335 length:174 start_codon:yes stop_codon:yes gene_type:complete